MKRWYIVAFAFVFLLCAVCPVHATFIDTTNADAYTEVDITTPSTEGGSDGVVLWDLKSGNTSAVISAGSEGEIYNNSAIWTIGSNGEDDIFDVDLSWNEIIPNFDVLSAEAKSDFTLLTSSLTLGWTLSIDEPENETIADYAGADDFSISLINRDTGASSAITGASGTVESDFLVAGANYSILVSGSTLAQYDAGGLDLVLTFSEMAQVGDDDDDDDGPNHEPVPEPSTMILLGCGLLGFAQTRKNKRL